MLASNHISWTDITRPQQPRQGLLHRQVGARPAGRSSARSARLQRTVFVERERKRRSGAQASEIATAAGGRRRDGAVCRGQHLRRQSDHAVQEHAVRRRRDGDPQAAPPKRCRSSRWRSPNQAARHADGPPAPHARRLDRRHRSRSAFHGACCARGRSTSTCISASRSTFNARKRPQGGDPADGGRVRKMVAPRCATRAGPAKAQRESAVFCRRKGARSPPHGLDTTAP